MFVRCILPLCLLLGTPFLLHAGGLEGGGGIPDGSLLAVLTIALYCLFPIAFLEGTYSFGNFAIWQIPIVVVSGVIAFVGLKPWKSWMRILLFLLAYPLSIIATNVWALSHRVDHSNDFPKSKIIEQIDEHSPPTQQEIISKLGTPLTQRVVSSSDADLPDSIKASMKKHGLSEAILLTFVEEAWGTRWTHHLMFDVTSGKFLSAAAASKRDQSRRGK